MADKIDVTKADVVREVVKIAAEDPEFRAQLIANPKEALKAKTGFDFPQGSKVEVVQEGPNQTVIVLPAAQGEELGDEELEKVAGGVQAAQMQQFSRGQFMTRFQTGGGLKQGGKLPGGEAGLNLQWG